MKTESRAWRPIPLPPHGNHTTSFHSILQYSLSHSIPFLCTPHYALSLSLQSFTPYYSTLFLIPYLSFALHTTPFHSTLQSFTPHYSLFQSILFSAIHTKPSHSTLHTFTLFYIPFLIHTFPIHATLRPFTLITVFHSILLLFSFHTFPCNPH